MMMDDTVLFEDEVNPAMDAAFDAGLEVTALHNHFFFDEPKVYFLHVGGMGSTARLATGVKKIYEKVAEIRAAKPRPSSQFHGTIPKENKISPEPLENILGVKGTYPLLWSNGIYLKSFCQTIAIGMCFSTTGMP
jgi:hypothetical protein